MILRDISSSFNYKRGCPSIDPQLRKEAYYCVSHEEIYPQMAKHTYFKNLALKDVRDPDGDET